MATSEWPFLYPKGAEMTTFKIGVQAKGFYNFMNYNEESIPVSVEWEGGKISANLNADDYDVEDLRNTEWPELAETIASHVATKYMYHPDSAKAKELLAWLADDPEDEKVCMIENAEQEYRIPFAVSAVRSALRMLGTDSKKRVLAEVSA